ncbi:MAG: hypothetical protein IT425_14305 [Pirellulales bacterium]|nr:hypothetical protein [Pirellulales bacterium]
MSNAELATQPTFRTATQKPKFGIYYAMLLIALFAMLVACLFCYLEIRRFGGFGTVKGRISAAPSRQMSVDGLVAAPSVAGRSVLLG